MKNELLISGIFLVLLALLLNPFKLWMPTAFHAMLVLGLVIVFSFFALFVWKESPQDERESLHRLIAARSAFLVGAALLLAGIIVQSFSHSLDIWLLAALVAMILAKLVGLVYGKIKY